MKIRMVYECEKCGKKYLDVEEARECENNHHNVLEIVTQIYDGDDTLYPRKLIVKMSDGSEHSYVINGELPFWRRA